jgi:hypothetical protein
MPICAPKIAPQKGYNHIAAGKKNVGILITGQKKPQAR